MSGSPQQDRFDYVRNTADDTHRKSMSLDFVKRKDAIRIRGNRVYLLARGYDDEALAVYARWHSDEDTAMFLSRHNSVTSIEAERRHAEEILDEGCHAFNILDLGRLAIVGSCSIRTSDANGIVAIDIGDPASRGRGLGVETMWLLARFAFNELRLHRLELIASADNERALRCYERAGFSECGRLSEVTWSGGRWHDAVVMQLLEGDWRELVTAMVATGEGADGAEGTTTGMEGDGEASR